MSEAWSDNEIRTFRFEMKAHGSVSLACMMIRKDPDDPIVERYVAQWRTPPPPRLVRGAIQQGETM